MVVSRKNGNSSMMGQGIKRASQGISLILISLVFELHPKRRENTWFILSEHTCAQ